MYLSRLILNAANRQVRRDLSDCQELHRTILRAFPAVTGEAKARTEFGVLHRLEAQARGDRLVLYVQSVERPNWSWLEAMDYLAPSSSDLPNLALKEVDAGYERLAVGTVLRFRLRANPTRKVGTPLKAERLAGQAKGNGHRVPLVKLEDQIDWLKRKGADGGFELLTVRTTAGVADLTTDGEIRETGRRPKPERGENGSAAWEQLCFQGVLFEGHLRVSNRERFLETLRRGVGSGKAYGFGLLSIARGG